MTKLILIFSVGFSLSASAQNACSSYMNSVSKGTAAQKLAQFIDFDWNYLLKESPEWSTYVGRREYNSLWTDISITSIERRKKEDICRLEALKKIHRLQLKGNDLINYDLLFDKAKLAVLGNAFPSEFLVIDHLSGLQSEVPETLSAMPKANRQDAEAMLSRLEKIPSLVKQTEELLKEGLKRGITPVRMFLTKVPPQLEALANPKIEDSPLFKPFLEFDGSLSEPEKKEIQNRAREIIQTSVNPSLIALRDFLIKEYIPKARETISMRDLPNGADWYAYSVRSHTTTDMTPAQIHDLGLKEVTRINLEMTKVREGLNFKGDVDAFNKFLLSDKRFYFTDKEALLTSYRDIAKKIDPTLPKLFKVLPRLTYGVQEMPEYKAKAFATAYYQPGSMHNGQAGYFVANTYDLKSRPKWAMEALALHEAVPGHHLQISLAQEMPNLPDFRKYDGYTAFVEGWGLYAESLGGELGFYKDPYSRYGQLTYEMWRAVRLVVDTGIHFHGWSRDKAIEYMMSQIPKTRQECEVEIDRYITWPGQALAYKVGQLKISELRNRAQAELGERFDIREFHEQVLKNGAIPLDVLDKAVTAWITAEKKKLTK